MRPIAGVLLALACLPPAYAGFVYAYQVMGFAGLAVRIGEDAVPAEAILQIGLTAAQVAIIAGALLVIWQGATRRQPRRSAIALAVAWLAGAPLFVMFLRLG